MPVHVGGVAAVRIDVEAQGRIVADRPSVARLAQRVVTVVPQHRLHEENLAVVPDRYAKVGPVAENDGLPLGKAERTVTDDVGAGQKKDQRGKGGRHNEKDIS